MYFLSSVRPSALPQGAFLPPKTHVLFSINRESVFLCLRYIQAQLLGSKVVFRVHETLVWNTLPESSGIQRIFRNPADLPEVT